MIKNTQKLAFYSIYTAIFAVGIIGFNFLATPLANAQATTNNAGNGSQLFCKRDFGNFLANGLDLDGEGFVDYWQDITVRYSSNYCRFSDIESLLNRIDKARMAIRQAFYVCDNVTTAKASTEYYKMSAELYYLRHFVNTSSPPNKKASEAEKAQGVVKINIWQQFKERFVDKGQYFNEKTALDLFNQLEAKYKNKLEEYKNCEDPNLTDLKQKTQELLGSLDTIKKMGKQFQEKTKQIINKTKAKVQANPGLIGGAFSASSFSDYFQKSIDLRINDESGYTATPWEELKSGLVENAPVDLANQAAQSATSGTKKIAPDNQGGTSAMTQAALTYNSVFGDLQKIDQRQTLQNEDFNYLAEYDLKYRQTSGAGLDQLVVNFEDLQEILKDSFDPLNRVKVCTANIVGKQCGG